MVLKKEKQVIHLMDAHLDRITEWFKIAVDTIELYLKNDISGAEAKALEMKQIEKEIENIRYDIWDNLYKGAYLPMIRQDIYTILQNIGKVTHAADVCCDQFLCHRPDIPQNLKDSCIRLVKNSFNIIIPLRESVLGYLKGDDIIEVIRSKFIHVWNMKTEVGEAVHNLKQEIFSSDFDPWHRIQLNSCMDAIEEVSHQAGETAEDMQCIAMKSVV